MNKMHDLILKILENNSLDKNNLYNYVNYFKKYLHISKELFIYIMELTFDDSLIDENSTNRDFENLFFSKYYLNFSILKKYSHYNFINNYNDLINLINSSRNCYLLFENINKKNINYYIVEWETMHDNYYANL